MAEGSFCDRSNVPNTTQPNLIASRSFIDGGHLQVALYITDSMGFQLFFFFCKEDLRHMNIFKSVCSLVNIASHVVVSWFMENSIKKQGVISKRKITNTKICMTCVKDTQFITGTID